MKFFSALHHAVVKKNFEICQLLINHKRINPDIRSHEGLTALFVGIVTNCPIEIIKLLLRKRNELVLITNNEQVSPIHEAIKHNRLDIVKILVEKGANVNAYDLDLENALHYAVSNCNYQMIEYLINETEVDPTAKNRDEMNPISLLIIRAQNEPEDVVTSCFHLLLEKTFYLVSDTYNISDIFQPAFLATVYSRKEIVKFIIHNIYSVNNSKFDMIKQLFEAFEESDNDGDEDEEELFYYLLVFLHDKIDRFDKFNFPRFSEINYFMCYRSVMYVIQKLLVSPKSVELAIKLVSHLEQIGILIVGLKEFDENLGMILYNKFSKISFEKQQQRLDCSKVLLEFFITRGIKINNVITSILHSIAIAPESTSNNLNKMSSLLKLLFRYNSTFFIDTDCWKQINEFKNLHDNIRQIVLWIIETYGTIIICELLGLKKAYSLKHLCRNAIRMRLKNNLKSIEHLELPESLINYLVYID